MPHDVQSCGIRAESCPLCAGPSQPVVPAGPRPFQHCRLCDLIVVPRQWHLSPDEERARYLRHENTIDNAAYVERFHRLIAMIRELAPQARRVLDYGCGPAPIFVELLRRAGYDAIGYDPYFAPDADLSRPFDAIVSVETVEHFAEPGTEFRRMASCLTPGGGLAILTKFHPGADSMNDWWYARDPTHVAFYSPTTFRYIQSAFGFEAITLDDLSVALLCGKGELRATASPATDPPKASDSPRSASYSPPSAPS